MRTIKILWILLLGMVSIPFWAQDAGICISGKITDVNGCPMESVTLLLLHAADSSYVTGGITDTNGLFAFAGLKPQDYYLEVTMLGFRKQYIPIRFLTDRQNKNLGTLVLEEDSRMLSGVTVTGKRSLMKMEPGTTTFHMDTMVSGSQGNVLDALRSLPGVVVNEDGSVLLNGQPGIHVLVNGKSTYLSGDKLVNYLRSMPVSSIKDIELVTNPSAKYDASGKTGLIDIRTQKVATKGWTAHINTGYQQNQDGRWNAGGRFTWQKNKVGVFMDYSHSQGKYKSTLDVFREYRRPEGKAEEDMQVNQSSYLKDRIRANWVRIGMDYDINEQFTFGLSSIGDFLTKRLPGSTETRFNRKGSPVDSILYTQNESGLNQRGFSGGTCLSYKDDRKRTADISFDYLLHAHQEAIWMESEMRYPAALLLNSDRMRGDLKGNIHMYSAQANTTIPLFQKATLQAGAKFTWVNLDNNALYQNDRQKGWQTNYGLSNSYDYSENINAAYIQANTQTGYFNLEAGLRLEQTRISGVHHPSDVALRDSSYRDTYLHLFPTLTVRYNFPGTENSLSVLYNRRIVRPNYRDLSPFNYIWDEYTRSTGNPDLRAELTDNIEWTYIHKWMYRATLFFSHTKDPIMQNIELLDNDVAVVYPENFKNNLRIGVRLDAGNLIRLKTWRMTANATCFYSLYKWEEFGKAIEKKLFTPSASINNQFTFPYGWNAELSGFYNGRMAIGQATVKPHYSVSAAIQKKVWGDRLTLRLYANDLFQSNRQDLEMTLVGNRGEASTRQFNDYRCIGISVSLYLKQGKASEKNRRDTTIDQSKRISL